MLWQETLLQPSRDCFSSLERVFPSYCSTIVQKQMLSGVNTTQMYLHVKNQGYKRNMRLD